MIIASSLMPKTAANALQKMDDVLWLEPQPQVYESIATHPDIFFCQKRTMLIASPDIPEAWAEKLIQSGIELIFGESKLGKHYPLTASYNAVFADKLLIHHRDRSDKVLKTAGFEAEEVHVEQAYTRCNLLHLTDKHFITSDKGIYRQLNARGMNLLYIDPKQIELEGHRHGFFGGCCGINNQVLVCCGQLNTLHEAPAIRQLLQQIGFGLIELYEGPMTDVGSILFC